MSQKVGQKVKGWSSFIVCSKSKRQKIKKLKKSWIFFKKNSKPKVNLIFSHVNHIFLIYWTMELDPQAFRHTCCTLWKGVFLMWKRVQFKVQFVSNWSQPRLLVLEPLKPTKKKTQQPFSNPNLKVQWCLRILICIFFISSEKNKLQKLKLSI